jgi:hypothetical protein
MLNSKIPFCVVFIARFGRTRLKVFVTFELGRKAGLGGR